MKLTDDMLRNAASEAAQYMYEKSVRNTENQSHTFSPWFEREMEELIRVQEQQEIRRKIFRYSRNIAAAILVIIITLPIFSSEVRASYQDFFQVIAQKIGGDTEVKLVMKGSHDKNEFVPAELGWIPDGMTKVSDAVEDTYLHQFYQDKDGKYFGVDQQLVTVEHGEVSWLGEDAKVSEIELRGTTATLTEYNGTVMLVWHESGCLLELSGTISKENLLKVAENIMISNPKNDN